MKHFLKFAGAPLGACLAAALASGAAFAGDRVGILECDLSGSPPSIGADTQSVDCVFEDEAEGAHPVHYVGTLSREGANIGVHGPGIMVWGVIAETNHIGPGALAGSYEGVGASLKLGVGGGASALGGGPGHMISLQPFAAHGGEGLGVTAGVESLTLVYAPDAPAPRMRHRQRRHR
jgi:hypothetical protein